MRIASYAMIALAIIYTLVSFFLGQVHATPSPDPYLRVSNENYYYWATIWYGTSILAGWILAAASMQLMAHANGGKGNFEDMIALTGVATALASIPTALPDIVSTFLQWINVIDAKSWQYSIQHPGFWNAVTWGYMILYLICFIIFYPLAVQVVHKINSWRFVFIGFIGFVIYQGFIFIFIR